MRQDTCVRIAPRTAGADHAVDFEGLYCPEGADKDGYLYYSKSSASGISSHFHVSSCAL